MGKKLTKKNKIDRAIVSSILNVTFDSYEWDVIYQAMQEKARELSERKFYAASGYHRDVMERDLEFLHGTLMPKILKIRGNFKFIRAPRLGFSD